MQTWQPENLVRLGCAGMNGRLTKSRAFAQIKEQKPNSGWHIGEVVQKPAKPI
jgi:hypothetical protein